MRRGGKVSDMVCWHAHRDMFNIIHEASVFKVDFVVRKDTRHAMGARMLTTAKALARAGIALELPGASESELRRRLFLRFYGDEIPEPHRSRIAARIAATDRP